MGKFFGFLLVLILGSFAYFSLRPIKTVELLDTLRVSGKVSEIYQKSNDIFIKLKDVKNTNDTINNDEIVYFIKDGITKGVPLERMKKILKEKIITIYYTKNNLDFFDPLDPFDKERYIAKIRSINEVVYNEIK